MEGFQVDIILNSLKELQEEKGRNERILAEEYHKRRELEAELEEATSKYRVVSEKHAKVKEAVNVTELKVSQIQAQVKMIEQINNEKRERIRQLNQKIEELQEKKDEQLSTFESQISILTDKFRTAWHEFADHALDKAMEGYDKQLETLSTLVATNESSLNKLMSHLDNHKEGEEERGSGEITAATWQMVIKMFKEENEASKSALEKTKQSMKVEQLQEEQTKMSKLLDSLEQRLTGGPPHHEE